MSPLSNPDRPYKSRALNFINRQLLRLGDRASTGLRQLKTATVWGVQLIAYPLYLVLQTSTRLGQTIKAKATTLLSSPEEKQAMSSVGSQPTAVMLDSIHPWLKNTSYRMLPLTQTRESIRQRLQKQAKSLASLGVAHSAIEPSSSDAPATLDTEIESYFIQGIATYLETGKLLLVTTENQAVDLLSDSQHQQLTQRIKILLECYEEIQQPWWWRVSQQRKRGRFRLIRWLAQFMIWVQTRPLAKHLNLFQESQFSFASGYQEISQIPPLPPKSEGMVKLDETLARWEKTKLAPAVKRLRKWIEDLDCTEGNNRVFALIRSAVDYFYGTTPDKRLTGEKVSQTQLQPVAKLVQRAKGMINGSASDRETDPYSLVRLVEAAYQHFFGKSERSPAFPPEIETNDEPWLSKTDLFEENRKPLAPATEVALQLTPPVKTAKETQEAESETAAEPLSTEAVSMGYEKHILTQILEWLDRALVWLEERLLQLWRWLKQYFPLKGN